MLHDAPHAQVPDGRLSQEVLENIEATLREEVGADPADTLPALGRRPDQLGAPDRHGERSGCRMMAGGRPAEVSREMLGLLDEIEGTLSGSRLNYAVRGA